MKGKIMFFSFLVTGMLLAPPHAMPDAAQCPELSLETAYKTALQSSPLMHQARAATEQADAEVKKAISAFLPKVDIELDYSHSNKPPKVFSDKLDQQEFSREDFEIETLNDPGYRDNWGARIVFTQPLFNQGREYIGYMMAGTGRKLASIKLDSAKQGLLYMVEKAYYQTLLAKERVEVLKQSVKTARRNEELACRRHDTGMALKSDVLNAQVRRTETERALIDAENGYSIAMAELNKVMGSPMDTVWKLREENESGLTRSHELEYWIDIAKQRRPDLLEARKQLELARYRTKQARFTYLPSLNIQAIYDTNRNNLAYPGGDDWTVMASASINIFNGLGDRAAVSSAAAAEKQAEALAREQEAKTELEVRKAFYNLQKAGKQLLVMEKSVQQAEESLRILSRRYSNGLALMVELLSADTVLKKERLRKARARFDVRLAGTRLKWSAGALGHPPARETERLKDYRNDSNEQD